MSIKTNGIHHIVITVSDLDRAKAFYMSLLGFTHVTDLGPDRVLLTTGSVMLAIGLPPDPSQAIDNDRFNENRVGLDHISFSVESRAELETAVNLFDQHNVPHGEITDLRPNAPVIFLAFRDPDNIQLELTAPAG